MRKFLLALAIVASTLTVSAGTANAACVSYTFVNGHLVPSSTGCTTSATGTNGSGGSSSSGSNGTSTPGKTTNNCVPVTSCKASATGTGGKGR